MLPTLIEVPTSPYSGGTPRLSASTREVGHPFASSRYAPSRFTRCRQLRTRDVRKRKGMVICSCPRSESDLGETPTRCDTTLPWVDTMGEGVEAS